MKIIKFLILVGSLFLFNGCVPSVGVSVPVGNHTAVGIDTNGNVGVGIGL